MKKRPLSKTEAKAEAFVKCTRALATLYRRGDVFMADAEEVVAMLAVRWTTQNRKLKVVVEG